MKGVVTKTPTQSPTTKLTKAPTHSPNDKETQPPSTPSPKTMTPTKAPQQTSNPTPKVRPETPTPTPKALPATPRPTPTFCSCSPRVLELTFDFSLDCEPMNVDLSSGGIEDATCIVTGFDNINVTDLVPVDVSSVQIIEIGQNGAPISVAQETGDFRDGDAFAYTSISFEGAVAPRALQIRALGRNVEGEPLVLQWAITFTNSCQFFPVVQVNDSLGWTIFVSTIGSTVFGCFHSSHILFFFVVSTDGNR